MIWHAPAISTTWETEQWCVLTDVTGFLPPGCQVRITPSKLPVTNNETLIHLVKLKERKQLNIDKYCLKKVFQQTQNN